LSGCENDMMPDFVADKKSLGLDAQNEAPCIKQKVQQWVCFYNVFCLCVEPTDTAKDTIQWVFCLCVECTSTVRGFSLRVELTVEG
jgi:hypothetical protein